MKVIHMYCVRWLIYNKNSIARYINNIILCIILSRMLWRWQSREIETLEWNIWKKVNGENHCFTLGSSWNWNSIMSFWSSSANMSICLDFYLINLYHNYITAEILTPNELMHTFFYKCTLELYFSDWVNEINENW